VPRTPPHADALTAAFDLGSSLAPPEQVASGWGGHNFLWRLITTRGTWAIKEVGRELSLDPEATLALELAAHAGGIAMPRPVPTRSGSCLFVLHERHYRCHEWVDGTPLQWHAVSAAHAAEVGRILAKLHGLRLAWSPRLTPPRATPGIDQWRHLAEQARSSSPEVARQVDRAMPVIEQLERLAAETWSLDGMVGSHRDLTPTNIMRVESTGDLVVVDWDAAGPVVPRQEVACFSLVLAERANGEGYAGDVASAFVSGYRDSAGDFAFSGPADLAMLVQGQLWWTEQNVRMALRPEVSPRQHESAAIRLQNLQLLPKRLTGILATLAGCL
jgi:aminoglycoside phosphotransferase (APT) family kinase protein